MWYKSLATATLFPASAEQWASLRTNGTSLGNPEARESPTKKYERGLPTTNTNTGPRRIYTVHVQEAASTRPWGWTWGTSPGLPVLDVPDKGSWMLSVAHPATVWSLLRPWGRSALCSWTARRRDSGVSPALCCLWGPRRGPGWLPRRKRFSTTNDQRKCRRNIMKGKGTPQLAVFQRSGFSRASFLPASLQDQACVAQQRAMCWGKGAGVLSEEDQGPKGQETLFPPLLAHAIKPFTVVKKKKVLLQPRKITLITSPLYIRSITLI